AKDVGLVATSVLVERDRLGGRGKRILLGALLHVDKAVGQRPIAVHFSVLDVDLFAMLLHANRVLVHMDDGQLGLCALKRNLTDDLAHGGLVDRRGLLLRRRRGLLRGLGLLLAASG